MDISLGELRELVMDREASSVGSEILGRVLTEGLLLEKTDFLISASREPIFSFCTET